MTRLTLAAAVLAAAAAVACGGHATRGVGPRVKLQLDSPGDGATVQATWVQVRGRVRPARAAVEVAGQPAVVNNGGFSASVPLRSGDNVIDVSATAPGSRPVVAALRVRRDDRVTVPALAGQDPDVAQARLERLGLKVDRERGGGFFDPIIPAAARVCALQPGAGSRVAPGSRVTLVWARHC